MSTTNIRNGINIVEMYPTASDSGTPTKYLAAGTQVTIVDQSTSDMWVQVTHGSTTGWVIRAFTTLDPVSSTITDTTYDYVIPARLYDTEAQNRIAGDSAEATARQTADTTLQTNITTEATTRAAADTALDARLNALEENSATTDSVTKTYVDAAVAAEATARASAVSAEATTRSTAITQERTLRANADATETASREAADDRLDTELDSIRM